MSVSYFAYQVAEYVRNLESFEIRPAIMQSHHIGEAVSNGILQAGLNFQSVVLPRLIRIRRLFPRATTVSAFTAVVEEHGPHYVLNWNHHEKPRRLEKLLKALGNHRVETIVELRNWLKVAKSREILLSIRGVGPKTIDYLNCLVGNQGVAVDRHIRSFVAEAGVGQLSYIQTKQVVEYAADILQISRSALDASIWHYQSSNNANILHFLEN